MGPSGCGKSTLLKALSCRIENKALSYGNLTLDDKCIDLNEFMNITSFVGESDIAFDRLTLDMVLHYTAKFKMKKTSLKDINERCNFYKSKLHLQEISGNKFQNLTTSERKRLYIAAALISESKIVYIDEPTGEMDAMIANDVIETLKYAATKEHKIILLSIDQPSNHIFNMFDKLLLLYEGKTIYFGPSADCITKLNSVGIEKKEEIPIAEFLLSIFHKDFGYNEQGKFESHIQNLVDEFKGEEICENMKIKKNNGIINYKINTDDVSLLMKRRFDTNYESKLAFFKSFYLKFLLVAIANISLFMLISNRMDTAVTFLPESKNFSDAIKNDPKIIDAAKSIQRSYPLIILPATFAFFSLSSLINVFGIESGVVSNELESNFYSITSYYISVFVYEILIHSITPLLIFSIVVIAYFNCCSILIANAYLLSILYFAPMVLLAASFTFKRKTLCFLACVIVLTSVVPAIFISEIFEQLDPKNDYKFGWIKLIYLFVPYHYYTALLGATCYNLIKHKLKDFIINEELKATIDFINNRIKHFSVFYGNKQMYYILLLLLAHILPILCVFLGIYILSLKLRPSMRSRYSKGSNKKRNESVKILSEKKNINENNNEDNNELSMKSKDANKDDLTKSKADKTHRSNASDNK
ncbi:hypothetical protein COBT_000182 [Conglomerata obtusa]